MKVVSIPATGERELKAAAARGDYARVVNLATSMSPKSRPEAVKFQAHMDIYEQARRQGDWRRTMRALADARDAAIAAGFPQLESVVSHRLVEVVNLQRGVRHP